MAIFQTGSIVGSISGNVDGVNFANPRGSKVVRKARRRVAAASNIQSRRQSDLSIVQHSWQSLDDDDRQAWHTFVADHQFPNRLGISRNLTAYQFYLKFNLSRILVLGSTADLPLYSPDIANSGTPTFVSDLITGIILDFPDESGSESVHVNVYGRNLYRTTAIAFSNSSTYLDSFDPGIPGTIDLTIPWGAKFGAPVEDQFIYARVVLTDDASFQPRRFWDLFAQTTP